MDRRSILDGIIKQNKFPTSVKSDNIKSDQNLFHKMLRVRGKNKEIGVSTEKDKNLLWFWRKKR